jgi:hypothetical protein
LADDEGAGAVFEIEGARGEEGLGVAGGGQGPDFVGVGAGVGETQEEE